MPDLSKLSPRETEVYHRLLKSWTMAEIAYAMNLRHQTIKSHAQKIYNKLKLHGRIPLLAERVRELEAAGRTKDTALDKAYGSSLHLLGEAHESTESIERYKQEGQGA